MTRKEIYAQIKSLGLAEEIKKCFNESYTRLPSAVLEEFVNDCLNSIDFVTVREDRAFQELLNVLAKKNILLKSEVTRILNA